MTWSIEFLEEAEKDMKTYEFYENKVQGFGNQSCLYGGACGWSNEDYRSFCQNR